MAGIVCKNLKFTYKDSKGKPTATVFEDFNISFEDKKTSVLLGPSGCGKTTLLNIISALEPDYEGSVLFDDKPANTITMREKDLAYLTQNVVLYPTMTIFENIAFPLRFTPLRQEEINLRVRKIAKELDIAHCLTRKTKYLSYGQQHRATLAKALIKEPTLLLLDEPFAGLDPLLKEDLMEFVKNYVTQNQVTTIYVTHDYNEALKMGDQIFVMDNGKIVFESNVADIRDSNNPYLITLRKASEIKKEDLHE